MEFRTSNEMKTLAVSIGGIVVLLVGGYILRSHWHERELVQKKQDLKVVGGHSLKVKHLHEKEEHALVVIDGKVWKPLQKVQAGKKKSRGAIEAEFYETVKQLRHPIGRFLPEFFGLDSMEGRSYIVLENITEGFLSPCILDLKMGRWAYDEEASPEKIAKEKKKYPPQDILGFRVSGMQVDMLRTKERFESTREWCLSLQPREIPEALEKFFFDGEEVRYNLISLFISQLRSLSECLEEYSMWRFYGSSLLVVYDGNVSILQHDELLKNTQYNEPIQSDFLRMRMIDFAHVFPIKDDKKDDKYLHGLHYLISALSGLLERPSPELHSQAAVITPIHKEQNHNKTLSNNFSTFQLAPTTVSPSNSLAVTAASSSKFQVGGAHGNIESSMGVLTKIEDAEDTFNVESEFYERVTDSRDPLINVMPKLIRIVRDVKPRRILMEDVTTLVQPIHRSTSTLINPVISQSPRSSKSNYKSLFSSSPSSQYRTLTSSPKRKVLQLSVSNSPSSTFINSAVYTTNMMSPSANPRQRRLSNISQISPRNQGNNNGNFFSSSHPLPPSSKVLSSSSSPSFSSEHTASSISEEFVAVMDCKLGYRSFRHDTKNKPEGSYYQKYISFVKDLPQSVVAAAWIKIPTVLNSNGPECLKQSLLGKRDYLSFRDATTTSLAHGFRLTALKHEKFEVSQEQARSVTSAIEFTKYLEQFLLNREGKFDVQLSKIYCEELQRVLDAYKKSRLAKTHEFVGTSLLFIHANGIAKVRWIDFANVYEPSSVDANGISDGISNILHCLKALNFTNMKAPIDRMESGDSFYIESFTNASKSSQEELEEEEGIKRVNNA